MGHATPDDGTPDDPAPGRRVRASCAGGAAIWLLPSLPPGPPPTGPTTAAPSGAATLTANAWWAYHGNGQRTGYATSMPTYTGGMHIVRRLALDGAVYVPVGNATHYHANYVLPYWAPSLVKTQVVGAHLFYRWSGGWGQPNAFAQRYVAREANAQALRRIALSVPHEVPKPLLAIDGSSAAAVATLAREGRLVRRESGDWLLIDAPEETPEMRVVSHRRRLLAALPGRSDQ